MATSEFFKKKPKIARVVAIERVCIQFPYRIDNQGKPADIIIPKSKFADLDEDDLDELSSTLAKLEVEGRIVVVRIGFGETAENVGYTDAQGELISVKKALDIALQATGGRLLALSGDGTIGFDQVFATVDSLTDCQVELPPLSSVVVIDSDTFVTPFVIKNINTGKVTVKGHGTDTVENDASVLIRFNGESITLLPTPTGWFII